LDNVRDLVVKKFKPMNPFTPNHWRLSMAFVQWLKAINPIVLQDLPNLSGDTLDEAWEHMMAQWVIISTQAGCSE
jgi:hypothetical protein